ncbi:MAG: hypothetical protein JWO31_2988 [Phycisphaerales bacterium]|nr:hypothetical protein [Phycisphaerales bacterium]
MSKLGLFNGFIAFATFASLGVGCSSSSGDGTTSRGGSSPAVAVGDRKDGGTDRARVANGQAMYTLAFPTGDRATSVVQLDATGPEQVRLGQPYNYNLRVTNLTDTPLHDVRVERAALLANAGTPATKPTNSGLAANPGEARTAGARISASGTEPSKDVWTVGTLGPKESKTYQLAGTADEVGSASNCLSVAYRPSLCVVTRVVKPELQVTKEGPSQVLICQPITYTYRVTNTGTGALSAVRVDDALPDGLTGDAGQRALALNVGDLKEGETKTVTAAVKPQRTGQFSSRAVAASGDIRAQSREVSTAVSEPALAVNVEGPEAHYVGQAINYRVTVKNTGNTPAENTVVRLTAVGGSERLADRTIGTIPAGESRSFAVNIGSGGAGGTASLTAAVAATCARPAQDSASVTVLTVPALRLECVDSVDPVGVNGNTVYTINVKNQGNGPDNTIALKAVVPPEFTFVKGGGATPVTASGQNLTFAPVAALAPGAEVNWTVEVKAAKPGDARFYVEMTSGSLSRPVAENESTRVLSGDAAQDIQQGAPVVPQGKTGPAPANERPKGEQNTQPNK